MIWWRSEIEVCKISDIPFRKKNDIIIHSSTLCLDLLSNFWLFYNFCYKDLTYVPNLATFDRKNDGFNCCFSVYERRERFSNIIDYTLALFIRLALVTRQYVADMTRSRLEGLLDAFPKLVVSEKCIFYFLFFNNCIMHMSQFLLWIRQQQRSSGNHYSPNKLRFWKFTTHVQHWPLRRLVVFEECIYFIILNNIA